MNYIDFKEMVKNQILNYLPATYKDADVRIDEVYKTNEKKEALVIRSGEDTMVPVLYLDRWYQECHQGKEIQNVLQEMGAEYISALQKSPFISGFDVDRANEHLYCALVNYEMNQEYLSNIPHERMNDLAVIPRWLITNDSHGIQSFVVSHTIRDMIGCTERELLDIAKENTKNLFQPEIKSMIAILTGQMQETDDMGMYVLTNTQKQNGAVCIINKELMEEIAEKMGGDLIILPSSIHEVIIIRDEGSGYDGLKDMVKEINQSEVETEERLSNNIYRYDKKRKELTVITEDIKRDRKATDLKGEKKSARRR